MKCLPKTRSSYCQCMINRDGKTNVDCNIQFKTPTFQAKIQAGYTKILFPGIKTILEYWRVALLYHMYDQHCYFCQTCVRTPKIQWIQHLKHNSCRRREYGKQKIIKIKFFLVSQQICCFLLELIRTFYSEPY